MKKTAFFTFFLAIILSGSVWAQGLLENEYFSLDLPEGWEASYPQKLENGGTDINISKSSGDCLINISIMSYTGGGEELIRQISKTMASKGLVMGELRKDGDIWRCKFKQKESGGTLYLGVNGKAAAMTTIYGSSKLQREAARMLGRLQPKDTALFPHFD